jgi:hypothetical protein
LKTIALALSDPERKQQLVIAWLVENNSPGLPKNNF